jgi:phenylacetaldehyde dehydrogenase
MRYIDPRLSPAAAKFVQKEQRLFIGGEWTPAGDGKRIDVIDPSTRRIVTTIADAGERDVDHAVHAARTAYDGRWAAVKPNARAKLLIRLADLIEANGSELAELESVDNGKPITVAKAGIAGTAEMLRYMAGWATKLNGQTMNVSMSGEWHAYSLRQPVGVVGQIIPWNFPLNMAVWKIAPALCVGCTIVLKPAEQASLVVLRLAELIQEAGFPGGVVNVLTGSGEVTGAALASHPGVDKVAFTGSTETGRRIVRAALGNLKRVSLELGGKSPVFIMNDADVAAAAAGAAHAIFHATGQTCSAGSRLYVHGDVYDQVLSELVHHAQNLVVGEGLDAATEMGPVVSEAQLNRIRSYVDMSRECGAEVISAGSYDDARGYFVAPTVVTGIAVDSAPFREEIFGPVVCVTRFTETDVDALAELANDTEFGLFASVWTRDVRVAHRLARRIKAGTVGVNAHFIHDPAMPFGGFRQSGWGRERGAEALELYQETKSVAIRLD